MDAGATTNWGPGLWVLGGSAAAALGYLLINKSRLKSQPLETVDDYQARYQALIAELKEHTANKHLADAARWEAERERLQKAAAQVLRERDQKQHELRKAEARSEQKEQAKPTGFLANNPTLKGALLGGGLVSFFVFLGVQLNASSDSRPEGMSATGGPGPAVMQNQPPPVDEKLERLLAQAKNSPDDPDTLATAALALMRKQRFEEAVPMVHRATLIDPFHVRTRVGRSVIVALEGDLPRALSELESLAAKYPEAYDGRLFAGMMAMDQQDSARALVNFEAYLEQAGPEAPPMMRMAVQQLRAQAAAKPPLP